MKLIKERLCCRRGEAAVDSTVLFLVFAMLLALIMSFFAAYNQKNTQDMMAYEMIRYAEMRGRTQSDVASEVNRMMGIFELDADVQWEAEYLGASDKVQLGKPMTLTVVSKAHIGIGGILSLPVNVRSKATGRSEVYWK